MADFQIIPAIDLMSGKCVRLRQGRAEDQTVYSDDPAGMAEQFEAAGARRIHVVDLDGAFKGARENLEAVRSIRAAVSCEIEVGGGLRSIEAVRAAISEGVDYVVLGTLAVEAPEILDEILAEVPDQVIVALDARDGLVSVRGWVSEDAGIPVLDLARDQCKRGVSTFLYTDIARDGMLAGPNVEATRALAEATPASVIASGGVASQDDIQALADLNLDNLIGSIVGRAIYDGRVDLASAIRAIHK